MRNRKLIIKTTQPIFGLSHLSKLWDFECSLALRHSYECMLLKLF